MGREGYCCRSCKSSVELKRPCQTVSFFKPRLTAVLILDHPDRYCIVCPRSFVELLYVSAAQRHT